jgi:hypothetical protein
MTKLQRHVRREANKLIARRRYRERHGQALAPVWTIRVGPPTAEQKRRPKKGRVKKVVDNLSRSQHKKAMERRVKETK